MQFLCGVQTEAGLSAWKGLARALASFLEGVAELRFVI